MFLGLTDARDKHSATSRSVEQIILHPHFQPANYDNDIALLRLSQKVEFTELIRPVCLPPQHQQVGQMLHRARCTKVTEVTLLQGGDRLFTNL